MLTTTQVIKKYGQPGDIRYQETIILPYPMRLAWDMKTSVTKITCHTLVGGKLKNIFKGLELEYGYDRLKALEIDVYGGCFNHRPMRGTESKYAKAIEARNYSLAATYLSMHSWAIAIDLNPAKNTLRMGRDKAQFARPEYKPMIKIFYDNGFEGLGPEKNYDWQHFQVKS